MQKFKNGCKNLAKCGVGAAALGAFARAQAQTNTISGVSTELTGQLGSAYDTAIGIGVLAVGIGLVVYLIRKGVKVRG